MASLNLLEVYPFICPVPTEKRRKRPTFAPQRASSTATAEQSVPPALVTTAVGSRKADVGTVCLAGNDATAKEKSLLAIDRKLENQQNGYMKTTLDLPNDLVREIKLRAVDEGKKLKDVVADLIRRGLSRDDVARAMSPRKGHIDLPLFPTAADAPASHMTIGEIIAAEQQYLLEEHLERLRDSV